MATTIQRAHWSLAADERRNPAPDIRVWTAGNRVEPLADGAVHFASLYQALTAGRSRRSRLPGGLRRRHQRGVGGSGHRHRRGPIQGRGAGREDLWADLALATGLARSERGSERRTRSDGGRGRRGDAVLCSHPPRWLTPSKVRDRDSGLSCGVLDTERDRREPIDPAGLGDGARVFTRGPSAAIVARAISSGRPVIRWRSFSIRRRHSSKWRTAKGGCRRGTTVTAPARDHRAGCGPISPSAYPDFNGPGPSRSAAGFTTRMVAQSVTGSLIAPDPEDQ